MSAPVDVLAVLDRLIGNARTMAGLSGDPLLRENLRDGEKARAAVAELIAADKEYDEATDAAAGFIEDAYEEDSYGVYGSEFYRCLACDAESGAGLLNNGVTHESDCVRHRYEIAIQRRRAALARVQGVKS